MTTNKNERLHFLNKELFILEMKDHWDAADWSYYRELKEEIKELEKNADSND